MARGLVPKQSQTDNESSVDWPIKRQQKTGESEEWLSQFSNLKGNKGLENVYLKWKFIQ